MVDVALREVGFHRRKNILHLCTRDRQGGADQSLGRQAGRARSELARLISYPIPRWMREEKKFQLKIMEEKYFSFQY